MDLYILRVPTFSDAMWYIHSLCCEVSDLYIFRNVAFLYSDLVDETGKTITTPDFYGKFSDQRFRWHHPLPVWGLGSWPSGGPGSHLPDWTQGKVGNHTKKSRNHHVSTPQSQFVHQFLSDRVHQFHHGVIREVNGWRVGWSWCTSPKINMSPKKGPFILPTIPTIDFQGYDSFRECNCILTSPRTVRTFGMVFPGSRERPGVLESCQ